MHALRLAPTLLALTGALHAQTFNVDFGSVAFGAGTPSATYGAASGQAGVWNSVDAR
jgi:hypothetical protein